VSLNRLVGGQEQFVRNGEAEHPGGRGVDDELELARLNDRQIRSLRALDDAPGGNADLPPGIPHIHSLHSSLVALTLHASHNRAQRNWIAVCIARDGLRHPTIHSIADLPDGVHVACGCLGQQCPSYLTQSLMISPAAAISIRSASRNGL